ncbi:MAG: hypothetical protein AAF745_07730 [Planctomycetota bacterium]
MADCPECVDRLGRICGCGWSDGYHACVSSGVRPLDNLPPRSFAAQTTPRPQRLVPSQASYPSATAIHITPPRSVTHSKSHVFATNGIGSPLTFYDHVDSLRSVSYGWIRTDPIDDPEAAFLPNSGPMEPVPGYAIPRARLESPSQAAWPSRRSNQPPGQLPNFSETPPSNDAVDRSGAPLSDAELEAFRDYQRHREQKRRFEKYLIEPDDVEPSQSFGGPPAGSEARKQIQESQLRQKRNATQFPSANNPATQLGNDVRIDRNDAGLLTQPIDDGDAEANTMDTLLSPFPNLDREERRSINLDAPATDREMIPPGRSQPDDSMSHHEQATPAPRSWNPIYIGKRQSNASLMIQTDRFVRQPFISQPR